MQRSWVRGGRAPAHVLLPLACLCALLASLLLASALGARLPFGRLGTLGLLSPVAAWRVWAAWRRIDPVALRAAEMLGAGRLRRFGRLALPVLAASLAVDAMLAFVVAAGTLLLVR